MRRLPATGRKGGGGTMLTRKQHELLVYIDRHLRETGFSPSFEEMKEAVSPLRMMTVSPSRMPASTIESPATSSA